LGKITIMKEVKDCTTIEEIRESIDEIDYQILTSFGKRLEYVKAIVKFKSDAEGIVAKERQVEVFQKRRDWAEELGLDPDLFEEIYKMLVSWNIRKEMEIFSNKQTKNI
jgi:isochorismate pyruvate lyase